ncbi:hypothetical protein GQ53DRAFT_823615 [Thozetella sp. PMI_491]|nr:hypothetical protein GQ53DRAFT_823615 [Thozetella sp. PMI_491]
MSPTRGDGIALSATHFTDQPATFAMLYGCTPYFQDLAGAYMEQVESSGEPWHPLLLPALFAELERKRLLNLLEREKTRLRQRILDVDIEPHNDDQKCHADKIEPASSTELTKAWITLSQLKNGLESLKSQLVTMVEHSKWLSGSIFQLRLSEPGHCALERAMGKVIEDRLQAITSELESQTRSYESLLGGMTMVAQIACISVPQIPSSRT